MAVMKVKTEMIANIAGSPKSKRTSYDSSDDV